MKLWSRTVILYLLIALARSEEQLESDGAQPAGVCNVAECFKLFNSRLEAIEMAVRKIVSVVSSQTSDVFAPIKAILEEDPTIISIMSSNSTPYSSIRNNTNASSVNNDAFKESGQKQGKNTAVDNLKTAIKCSLARFMDSTSIDPNLLSDSPGSVTALLYKDIIKVKWLIPAMECLKVSSGVWIRISESVGGHKIPVEAPLFVPQKCLKTLSRTWHSIDLASFSSTSKNNSCAFFLNTLLIQCRSYTVEVITNYQSLAGKAMHAELVIPPKLIGQANMLPLISASARSNSLTLNWEDRSGCAPQLTSLDLTIIQDGIAGYSKKANSTVTIPRSCFKKPKQEGNLFSLALPASELTCPIEWKPLDVCRKYTVEMNSRYSATWNGLSSSSEIFTEQEVTTNFSLNSNDVFLRCPRHNYFCSNLGCLSIDSYLCDASVHCNGGHDERYCVQDVCYKGGFRCGRQCIPKKLVCNGNYDCLDGSDEGPDCNYTCYQLTNPSGNFSSQKFPKPPTEIHMDKIIDTARKTMVSISVQPTHHIWLTFNRFNTVENQHAVKVYDGPYSTSPILLSHNGSTKPLSIRSSSNNLFVEFPSYLNTTYGIEAFYTSVKRTYDQFIPGCGGYIYGEGIIPNSLARTFFGGCFWYIETRQREDTLLIKTNMSDADIFWKAHSSLNLMVYDGWSTDDPVLYNGKEPGLQNKIVIYSIGHKMMVYLRASSSWTTPAREILGFPWRIATQKYTPHCNNHFEENTGTIKSPNYPILYPNSIDCRWSIKVEPGSKVRLLFAFFETQTDADFLFVYDGPTLRSPLLLAKSGSVLTPFVVNSSTNEVYVRFTSDDDTSSPGFLAVYSSV